MGQARYNIVRHNAGWAVSHDGALMADYETREAAFEATILPASNAIKQGHGVVITVEESRPDEPALGKD